MLSPAFFSMFLSAISYGKEPKDAIAFFGTFRHQLRKVPKGSRQRGKMFKIGC